MSNRIKYPRTPHLPWSPGKTSDDRVLSDVGMHVLGSSPLVVTEKMDGGNVTLMRDCFYARSVDSGTPPWEVYAKRVWARFAHDIPHGWRVSAESMLAKRSVFYNGLAGPLLVFGIWDDNETLLSWDDTVTWAEMLGIPTVPILGEVDSLEDAYNLWKATRDDFSSEGFVVRDRRAFPSSQFGHRVAKWVRANHVRTSDDWRHRDDFEQNVFLDDVELVVGGVYLCETRSISELAVFAGNDEFIGIREKFNERYLFTEHLWRERSGTIRPKKRVGDVPSDIELADNLGLRCTACDGRVSDTGPPYPKGYVCGGGCVDTKVYVAPNSALFEFLDVFQQV